MQRASLDGVKMCLNEDNMFTSKKYLVDTEINCLDDVYGFTNRYFKPKTGENYLFMKLIKMLIDENDELKQEIIKIKEKLC